MAASAQDIWRRLAAHGDLEGLGLAKVDGRWDVRGLQAPQSRSTEVKGFPPGVLMQQGFLQLKNAVWKDIHFSDCQLDQIRFFGLSVENCVFSTSKCSGWRIWSSSFKDTRFQNVDMRRSALGAVGEETRRNSYRNVEFVRTDHRGATFFSAEMIGCRFRDANLEKVDFGGTTFEDCTFSGLLDETTFYRSSWNYPQLPANEMKNVSFADARFRFVEFRNLDMDRVEWPRAADHVLVRNYRATLDCMIERLAGRGTTVARYVASTMAHRRKWAGDHQMTGVISPQDFLGEGEYELALEVLAECDC